MYIQPYSQKKNRPAFHIVLMTLGPHIDTKMDVHELLYVQNIYTKIME